MNAVCFISLKQKYTSNEPHCSFTLKTVCFLCCYLCRPSCGFMKRVRDWEWRCDCYYSPWQSYLGTTPCVRRARLPTILHRPAVCSRWCHPQSGSTHRPAEPHSRTPPRPPLGKKGEIHREWERESGLTINCNKRSNLAEVSHCSIFTLRQITS